MRTRAGEQTNAVFGVASMLLQILKTEQPDALIVCIDAGSETFRHQEYKEYKAGRAETPEDFYLQIPRCLELFQTFGFPIVSDAKYEADDFACSYAKAAVREDFRATIVSGDRDLFQLASDHVRIAVPSKGYQMPEYFTDKEVLKKFGVTPAQIPAYKGLTGDASDNLPGVHGIGPVAASKLLQEFGSLVKIYENLSHIKPAWRMKLETGKEQAFFCERMATLSCDASTPVPLRDCTIEIPAHDLAELFTKLEFAIANRRLMELRKTPYGALHCLQGEAFDGMEISLEEIDDVFSPKKEGKKSQNLDQLSLL